MPQYTWASAKTMYLRSRRSRPLAASARLVALNSESAESGSSMSSTEGVQSADVT
ncbi:hypothetical protein [Streptomyces cinnamoneus]|uniref:hypothetical protein n=1 Tax=Streptomyces cinnamoneus TaxID=53446 RepID=UPI0030B8FCF0